MVKYLPADAGDVGLIPGLGRSLWRGKWQPTPVFLPGKSHGQRSLGGCSPWDCKKLDMTEHKLTSHVLLLNGKKCTDPCFMQHLH